MIKEKIYNTTAIFAISTAMLCNSPALFAQEQLTTSIIEPEAPQVVAPPLVVPTLPETPITENTASDVAPTADTEIASPRNEATSKPATSARRAVVATPVAAAPIETSSTASVEELPLTPPLEALPAVEDTAAVNSPEQSSNQLSDGTGEDWIVYGGFAGALGLALAGAAIAARRRRRIEENEYDATHPALVYSEPAQRREPVTGNSLSIPASLRNLANGAIVGQRLCDRHSGHKLGYYEAQVDDGPTEANPFLTHAKRMRRARFLDAQLDNKASAFDRIPNGPALPTWNRASQTTVRQLEPAE